MTGSPALPAFRRSLCVLVESFNLACFGVNRFALLVKKEVYYCHRKVVFVCVCPPLAALVVNLEGNILRGFVCELGNMVDFCHLCVLLSVRGCDRSLLTPALTGFPPPLCACLIVESDVVSSVDFFFVPFDLSANRFLEILESLAVYDYVCNYIKLVFSRSEISNISFY